MQFLLVQNRQQTQDWTLIGSGANGLDIQEYTLYNAQLQKKIFEIKKKKTNLSEI